MDGLGTGVEAIVVRIGDVMDKLRLDLATLIQDDPRASYEKLVNHAVSDFTSASIDNSDALCAGAAPAGETVHLRGTTYMEFDVVSFGPVPLFAEAGDANAIEKAVAVLTGDVRSSHHLLSHAVKAPAVTGSDDDKPLAVDHGPPSSDDASHAVVAPFVAVGALPSAVKSVTNSRLPSQTNLPSAAIVFNRMVESTSSLKRDSGGIKSLGSRKRLGESVCSSLSRSGRSLVVGVKSFLPSERIKLRFWVLPDTASTAEAAIGASSV